MFGGREEAQQLDIYNFKKDQWHRGTKAPKAFNHFQAIFYEGFIWVIGSFQTNTFPKEIPADHIWLYAPANATWIKGPLIPKERRRGGAGLAIFNDKFYLAGGNTRGHDGGFVNWFDVYDPVANTWIVLKDAPTARDHFSLVTFNSKLFALGGRQSGGTEGVFKPLIANVDTYDLRQNTWQQETSLPTPRAAPAVAVFNNELFVMGGEGSQKGPAYTIVEAYHVAKKQWSKKANMIYPRHGTQAIVSGKGIYITGGSPKRGGGHQRHMEIYNKDQPKGKKQIISKLQLPKQLKIAPKSQLNISLKPKNGTTGCFISSVELEGKGNNKHREFIGKAAFKLKNTLDLTLLKHGQQKQFTLIHEGFKTKEEVFLKITYNGKMTTTSRIVLK
jgi:N-acetylneuraminic acid mutarotase